MWRPAVTLFVLFSLATGIIYPAVITGIGQLIFPRAANGSLIERDGIVVGSALIGQTFTGEKYFWSRPSATAARPHDAAASSGSNLGPTNPALLEAVRRRADSEKIPVDLVTSSASGLDPHLSPAAAFHQAARVARARGLEVEKVRALIEARIEGRTLQIWGEPRLNVLGLNLALDALQAAR